MAAAGNFTLSVDILHLSSSVYYSRDRNVPLVAALSMGCAPSSSSEQPSAAGSFLSLHHRTRTAVVSPLVAAYPLLPALNIAQKKTHHASCMPHAHRAL